MGDLIRSIQQTIDRFALLARGSTVVVGVSGGPDSLCLLHVLRVLAPDYELSLHVAHLNHQLRAADSDQDAAYVARLAQAWGLPATIVARDVMAFAQGTKLAVEEAARQMRYGFLAAVAHQVRSKTIAVAHHADDQAESVLMHVIRGSGVAGLRGMRPRSRLGDMQLAGYQPEVGNQRSDARSEPPSLTSDLQLPTSNLQPPAFDLWLIRPLLYVSRAEIEAYCEANDLHPRFDVSNLDQTYFRNWLRHTVLPLLAQHNPGVRDVLGRAAEVAAADYDFIHAEMESVWPRVTCQHDAAIVFKLVPWRALPLALQRATVREAIHRLRRSLRNINFVHVERAVELAGRGATGDQATLTEGLLLTVEYDTFTIADESRVPPLPDWPLLEPGAQLTLTIPGRSRLPGLDWALDAEIVTQVSGHRGNPDPWTAYLDADVCSGPLMLRTRLPGDRLAPAGLHGHHAKLNEIMINAKVPSRARDRMPILVCSQRIVWACGLRVDESARVTPGTRRVLCLRLIPLNHQPITG